MPDPSAGFLGGPRGRFDSAGREQLAALLDCELTPESTVLDIGCGCLRGGRWIIPLLATGHDCGIEPNREMLERGLRDFLDSGIAELKKPRFDHNDRFDLSGSTSRSHTWSRARCGATRRSLRSRRCSTAWRRSAPTRWSS